MRQPPSIPNIEQLFLCCSQEQCDPQILEELLSLYNFTAFTLQKAVELCQSNFTNAQNNKICLNLLRYELMVINGKAIRVDK